MPFHPPPIAIFVLVGVSVGSGVVGDVVIVPVIDAAVSMLEVDAGDAVLAWKVFYGSTSQKASPKSDPETPLCG